MSYAPGTVLASRYLLGEPIAFGGYGEVWRGTDLVLDRPVAVKLLLSTHARHPETLARFRAEARHAGVLAHENIARVYDYGEPDPPFLVMELVDGPSLGDVLAGGPLSATRTMGIIAGAATGLHAAHRAGLIHRDIKPGNLLLSRGEVVKITDFGISHAIDSAPVTATGLLLGTPAYMAPERVAGARATVASDLYSLGVVAHECLTGVRPFDGVALEVALAHQNASMPLLPDSVPADVAALVSQLTAKDPAARPASAGEVARRAAALAGAGAGHVGAGPVSAGVTSGPDQQPPGQRATLLLSQPAIGLDQAVPGRGRRGIRSLSPRVMLGAAVVVAAAVGLALASTLSPSPAPHLPPSAPSARSSPHPASAEQVTVNNAALAGQPVQTAVRQLQQLHLVVRVQWQPTSQQPPGRVVQVQPGGQVAVGSTVTVTGALRPAGQGNPPGQHGHGHGHGHGGQGGDQGGDQGGN